MIRPRALCHRGFVAARGLLIAPRLIGEAAARQRVLELWSPRASVFELDEGYLVLLPEPKHLRAEAAPGEVLVEQDGRLYSAPLLEDEIAALAPPEHALVLVRGGRALIAEADAEARIDPAVWLEVGELEVLEANTLG